MSAVKLDELIHQMENYLECWKQFNHYLGLARFKKFSPDDENQFMEIKSVITQELELILAFMDGGQVTREDVHSLMTAVPSMRFLSESNESALRNIENQIGVAGYSEEESFEGTSYTSDWELSLARSIRVANAVSFIVSGLLTNTIERPAAPKSRSNSSRM